MKQHTQPAPVQPATAPPASPRLRVDSEQLLRGATTLEIDHAGQRYLLRVTRENKLILTK
jgi:hemin uptake protein HemP